MVPLVQRAVQVARRLRAGAVGGDVEGAIQHDLVRGGRFHHFQVQRHTDLTHLGLQRDGDGVPPAVGQKIEFEPLSILLADAIAAGHPAHLVEKSLRLFGVRHLRPVDRIGKAGRKMPGRHDGEGGHDRIDDLVTVDSEADGLAHFQVFQQRIVVVHPDVPRAAWQFRDREVLAEPVKTQLLELHVAVHVGFAGLHCEVAGLGIDYETCLDAFEQGLFAVIVLKGFTSDQLARDEFHRPKIAGHVTRRRILIAELVDDGDVLDGECRRLVEKGWIFRQGTDLQRRLSDRREHHVLQGTTGARIVFLVPAQRGGNGLCIGGRAAPEDGIRLQLDPPQGRLDQLPADG